MKRFSLAGDVPPVLARSCSHRLASQGRIGFAALGSPTSDSAVDSLTALVGKPCVVGTASGSIAGSVLDFAAVAAVAASGIAAVASAADFVAGIAGAVAADLVGIAGDAAADFVKVAAADFETVAEADFEDVAAADFEDVVESAATD